MQTIFPSFPVKLFINVLFNILIKSVMHSTEQSSGGSVPAFLTKLWRLVDDQKYDDLISWAQNGQSFIIRQQSKFAKDVLPLYFKHSNMASFIRQLNMYGFRKVVNLEQGALHSEHDIEFFHQYFLKGQEPLLALIKRKVPATRSNVSTSVSTSEEVNVKPELVSEILTDMQVLKGKQENVDGLLSNMKRENEALWREVAYLRQKHMKQQQIVEKLIQFLVTLVQPSNMGMPNVNLVKRKGPLMLYNSNPATSPTEPKRSRINRQISQSGLGNPGTSSGPVIHDVTDALDPKPLFPHETTADKMLTEAALLNAQIEPDQMVTSPLSSELSPMVDSPAMPSPMRTMDDVIEPLSVLVPLTSEEDDPHPPEGVPMKSEERPNSLSLNMSLGGYEDTLNTPLVDPSQFQVTKVTQNQNEESKEGITLFSSADNHMQVALNDPIKYRKGNNTPLERTHLNEHLEGIETELDWLQEQLSGSALNFDVSNLLSLFGADDTVPGNNLPTDSLKFPGGEVSGNEVVQYHFHDLDGQASEDIDQITQLLLNSGQQMEKPEEDTLKDKKS